MRYQLPLKYKLAFFSTLLVIFVALSLSFYIRKGQKKAILERQTSARFDTVNALKQVAREAILVDDDTDMVNYVNLLQKSLSIDYAMVLQANGVVRVHTNPLLIGQKPEDPVTTKSIKNKNREAPLVQNITTELGDEIIDISIPIIIGLNPPEFKGIARIGFDKTGIDKEIEMSLRESDERIKQAFLIAIALGIFAAFILAAFITRPIETLRFGAKKIGEGKLDHRITVTTNDELGELATDFNQMAQKLSELDQMKQDFVSNVTHELRSPLTSIRGYLDLLSQGAAGELNAEQKDYLSIVKNSSVRLAHFIDNLLDIAKIDAHKLRLSPEPANLFEMGREMGVLFKPQLDEKSIAFKNNIPRNLTQAFVDKDKIVEVLINLTSNAIKFMPDNGTLEYQAVESSTYLEVSLHDTGPGIPPEMIGRLFNKFAQVQSNQGHARKHKGTGLGLTICKGIIEAHGGKIWIKSPAPSGTGTAFYFTIPKLTPEIQGKIQA